MKLNLKSKVMLYRGMAGWHFASIDKKASEKIKKSQAGIASECERPMRGAAKCERTLELSPSVAMRAPRAATRTEKA